jgi:murein DD-endopeptidase MepM/ murein hydrolase activator NlpD
MLPQNLLTQERKLKIRWFVTVSTLPLLGVVTAFGIVPQTQIDFSAAQVVSQEIALPATSNTASSINSNAVFWRVERVQRGDTVGELLQRLNVSDDAASNFLRKDNSAASFRKLTPGKSIQAETTADGGLIALRFTNNDGIQTVIERNGEGYKVSQLPAQLEQRIFMRTGEVKSSLFSATDEAGLPDAVASQMADIFGGDIDFHQDLRRGDKFSVVYEMTYSNGEPIRVGRILGAEFTNQGTTYSAYYFQTDANHGDYYSLDGKNVHKAFLRSPLEFSRVSSGFTGARLHPVLNRIRAHKGVDFAAPTGTRVKSTADGVVTFSGWQNGYGNVVLINHRGHYSSKYGHLSRFAAGLHKGQHISQGEVIGYVGMTGLATGPHLHYEFLIDGVQRDPLRVALPDALPIGARQMAAFKESIQAMRARLGLIRNTDLARLD